VVKFYLAIASSRQLTALSLSTFVPGLAEPLNETLGRTLSAFMWVPCTTP
jgi:hypothetical protein